MTLDDLTLPCWPSEITEKGVLHPHPDAPAVYEQMEQCAHLLAVYLLATRAGDDADMHHRHAFRTALSRAEFAHRRMTEGPTTASRMITEEDRTLIRRRALAIVRNTIAYQENSA